MFETSLLLALKSILLNLALPLVPGIIFVWLCFGTRFRGALLYILSWFVGVGIVAFGLFNFQFIYFGIGIRSYFVLLIVLLILLLVKIFWKKLSWNSYLTTLSLVSLWPDIVISYTKLSLAKKIFTWILSVFVFGFLALTLVHRTHFPTYGDDSFGNWNRPAYHIYQDGGIHLLGDENVILARGRLGYPIYIPLYKAVVSDFFGSFNDVYINMWQWFVFFGLLLFVFLIGFAKTKNIFFSLLPLGLIISLPLVYFHAVEGYMELASATYVVLMIWALMEFLSSSDIGYFSLAVLLGGILSYVKNDGFVVYMPGVFLAFALLLLLHKQCVPRCKTIRQNKSNLGLSVFFIIFFYLPFLLIKSFLHLGFNQAAGEASGVGLSSGAHWEIFKVFPGTFLHMDNYNIILLLLLVLSIVLYRKRRSLEMNSYLPFLSGVVIFAILLAVFLFTSNYRFALDQTTINRVFTVVFVIILSFSFLPISREGDQ